MFGLQCPACVIGNRPTQECCCTCCVCACSCEAFVRACRGGEHQSRDLDNLCQSDPARKRYRLTFKSPPSSSSSSHITTRHLFREARARTCTINREIACAACTRHRASSSTPITERAALNVDWSCTCAQLRPLMRLLLEW